MNYSKEWIKQFQDNSMCLNEKAKEFESVLHVIFKKFNVIITSRVKDINSLSEKIIRKNYVSKYPEEKNIFEFLQDGIGIRIICLEHNEENSIYEELKKCYFGNVHFKDNVNFDKKSIEDQPEKLDNGHPIYRIDGHIDSFPFELQIKSLSHMLWGEIEHLLIYKNYKCSIGSSFFKTQTDQIFNDLIAINDRISDLKKYAIKDTLEQELEEIKEISKLILQKRCENIILELYTGIRIDFRHLYKAIIDECFYKCNVVYKEPQKKRKNVDENDMQDLIYLTFCNLLEQLKNIPKNAITKNFVIKSNESLFKQNKHENKTFELIKELVKEDDWALFFSIMVYLNENDEMKFFPNFISNIVKLFHISFETELFFNNFTASLHEEKDFNLINGRYLNKMKAVIRGSVLYLNELSVYNDLSRNEQEVIINYVYIISNECAKNGKIDKANIKILFYHLKISDEESEKYLMEYKADFIDNQSFIDVLGRLS